MKTALLILLAVALAVSARNAKRKYSRFVKFPDDDGVMQLVDLEEQPDVSAIETYATNPNNNQYLLYTRRNPSSPQTLRINNANSISSSNFNATLQTVVIVHGWRGSRNSNVNSGIRDAYLKKSNVNVIVLDWSGLAKSGYITATNGSPAIGRGLGQFLAFLNRVSKAAYSNMHLVGFSLGAHVVGNAGREVGGKIARVTGLDPAGPIWQSNSNRLGPNDGVYVEAIHTNGGILPNLGIRTAIANADFFVNGGRKQPGCSINVSCSHGRSWQLFAASVTYNRFTGRRCNNMNEVSSNSCKGNSLSMGNDDLSKRGNGIYRVNTGSSYPF